MRRQFFVGEVPEITIEDGVVHLIENEAEWCMPLRTFRLTVAASERALGEYDVRRAPVTPIRGRKNGHAASS